MYLRMRGRTGVDQIPHYPFWSGVCSRLSDACARARDAVYARLPSGRREQHHVMLVDDDDLNEPQTV